MDAPPEPPGLAEAGDYKLGPGDAVRVVVYGEEQLSGEFRVDGSLAMPLVGQIPVKGKTTRDLKKYLAKRLERGSVRNFVLGGVILKQKEPLHGTTQRAGYPGRDPRPAAGWC